MLVVFPVRWARECVFLCALTGESATDRTQMFERRKGESTSSDGQQAHCRAFDVLDWTVIECGLQRRGVRSVIHRGPQKERISRSDRLTEPGCIAGISVVGIERGQVHRPNID